MLKTHFRHHPLEAFLLACGRPNTPEMVSSHYFEQVTCQQCRDAVEKMLANVRAEHVRTMR